MDTPSLLLQELSSCNKMVRLMAHIAIWHYHHSQYLMEFYPGPGAVELRIGFINETKEPKERELRIRLLKPVKGELPSEFVAYLAKLNYAWAWLNCGSATAAASPANSHHALAAYKRVIATYNNSVYNRNLAAVEALHAIECLDCPWDGKTIFARKNEKGNWY